MTCPQHPQPVPCPSWEEIQKNYNSNIRLHNFEFQSNNRSLPGQRIFYASRCLQGGSSSNAPDCFESYQNILTVVNFIDEVIENPNHRLENYIASINYTQGEYINALWYGVQAVFGQKRINDHLRSFATDLTVVAHEFCHGLIAKIHGKGGLDKGEIYTDPRSNRKKLQYPESSALEESLCDIFAILVCNQDRPIKNWQWTIGKAIEEVRNLTEDKYNTPPYQNGYNPKLVCSNDPESVDIHENSIIHSRAFYHLVNFRADDREYLFNHEFARKAFYSVLRRVKPGEGFAHSRSIFLDEVRDYINSTQSSPEEKINEITKASFDRVGIPDLSNNCQNKG